MEIVENEVITLKVIRENYKIEFSDFHKNVKVNYSIIFKFKNV